MALECPNCRFPVSFWRTIRRTAWARFQCAVCGSVLAINAKRRFLAIIACVGCFAFFAFVAQLQRYGMAVLLGAYLLSLWPVFYLLDRVVLIERRSFRCRRCGYQLEGLTVPRCPECGATFDPSEKPRILERAGKPLPRSWHRWVVVLLVLLLLATIAANIVTYYRVRTGRQQTPAQQPADK